MEHDPAGRRTRVRPSPHLPRRRPARPRLRPPHRPDGRADGPQRRGARGGAAVAALPGTRLVAAPHGEGPQAARHGAEGARLHLPDQAAPDGRRDDGRPRHRRSRRPEGLPVGAGRRDMEGRAVGHGHGPGAGRRRVGLVAVEEGPQARGGPSADTGKSLPHRLRRRAPGRRRPARRHGAACAPGSFSARWPPHTATTTTPPGRASRSAGSGPLPQTRRCCTRQAPACSAGAASWGCARSPPCGTRPERGTRRPWWSGPARGRSAPRPRASGAARWWETPPQGRSGRSASPATCCAATTSTSHAPAWASPPSCTTSSRTRCGRRRRAGTRTPSSS